MAYIGRRREKKRRGRREDVEGIFGCWSSQEVGKLFEINVVYVESVLVLPYQINNPELTSAFAALLLAKIFSSTPAKYKIFKRPPVIHLISPFF